MYTLVLRRSNSPHYRYHIFGVGINVHFGLRGSIDYTTSLDPQVKRAYLRHLREMGCTLTMNSVEFWERWLLHNKLTLSEAIRDVELRFALDIRQ